MVGSQIIWPLQRISPCWHSTGQVPEQSSPLKLVCFKTHISSSLHPYSSISPSHKWRVSSHVRGHCWCAQMLSSWSFCLGMQSSSCLHPLGKFTFGQKSSVSSHSTGQKPSQSSMLSSEKPLWTQISFCKQPFAVCFWPHLICSAVHSTVQIRSHVSPFLSL